MASPLRCSVFIGARMTNGKKTTALVPRERVLSSIVEIRDEKVILDASLAEQSIELPLSRRERGQG